MKSSTQRPKLQRSMSMLKRHFQWRQPVRPFVSSTFIDFHEEREHLVKKIFPQLDKLCRNRGSYFAPVDLQWGINDEQTSSGNVIALCLDYINRCTPYFICLLGERYGSHRPMDAPPLPKNFRDLSDDAHWLDKNFLVAANNGYSWILQESHQTSSVTELEIIQAAFLNENTHCHFYVRQTAHVDYLFTDLPEEEREEKLKKYSSESDYAEIKMRDLKQRIAKKGLPIKFFKTPQELGDLVLEDWTNVIDTTCPDITDLVREMGGEQFQEWTAHEAYAETRRRVFVTTPAIQNLNAKLDEFIEPVIRYSMNGTENAHKANDHSNLLKGNRDVGTTENNKSMFVLIGERGSGKSSVVANWVKEFQDCHPSVKVLTHYVGATSISVDITSFMRRATYDLRDEYIGAQKDTASSSSTHDLADFHHISEAFSAAIAMGPCVLIIDGIDELSTTYGLSAQQIKELSWLATPLPAQCKIILTTVRSDLTYQALSKRRDTVIYTVPLMNDPDMKRSVVEEHLALHCKSLDKGQIDDIMEWKLSDRPLFLSVLANELRVIGNHKNLNKQITNYLETSNNRDLWRLIIERWIKDYSWTSDYPSSSITASVTSSATTQPFPLIGWVADAMRLIAVSRQGLMEKEILEILQMIGYTGNTEVSSLDWAMFRSASSDALIERPGGLLTFFHQHLREAVDHTLLGIVGNATRPSSNPGLPHEWERIKQQYHCYIAHYFMQQNHGPRRTEELPWQLEMSGELEALSKVLTEPRMFSTLSGEDEARKLDLHQYWKTLQEAGFQPAELYTDMVKKAGEIGPPEQLSSLVEIVLDVSDEKTEWAEKTQLTHGDINGVTSQSGGKDELDTDRKDMRNQLSVIEEAYSAENTNTPTTPVDSDKDVNEELQVVTSDSMSVNSMGCDALSEINSDSQQMEDNIDEINKDRAMIDDLFLTQASNSLIDSVSPDNMKPLGDDELAALARHAGQFLNELNQFESAGELLFMAYNYIKQKIPLDSSELVLMFKIEESLADWHLYQLKKTQAENFYKKALNTLIEMPEEDCANNYYKHMESKGRLLNRLGHLKIHEGQFKEALAYLEGAKDCMKAARSTTGRATVYYNLGVYWNKKGDFRRTEKYLRESLTLRESWYGASHPLVAEVLDDLACLLSNEKNKEGLNPIAAEPMFRRALQIREKSLGQKHLLVATTLFHLGRMLNTNGSRQYKKEAIELLKRSLDLRSTLLGPDHGITKAVRSCLIRAEKQLQHGEYDYAPVKQPDKRTVERPYSSMSWHDQEIEKLDKRSKAGYSNRTLLSRLSIRSGFTPTNRSPSRYSYRDTDNEYDSSLYRPTSSKYGDRSRMTTNGSVKFDATDFERRSVSGGKVLASDSRPVSAIGAPSIASSLQQSVSIRFKDERGESKARRTHSATSRCSTVLGSYYRSGAWSSSSRPISAMDEDSVHRSKCKIPGKFAWDPLNARNVHGPHSTIDTLLGDPPCPRPKSGLVHSAGWYHVPGRYSTNDQPYPSKRSQIRPFKRLPTYMYQQKVIRSGKDDLITPDVKKLASSSLESVTTQDINGSIPQVDSTDEDTNKVPSTSKITFKDDIETKD
ncbi:tetratricopeptide repeat protein 41-like [Ptychodera flava]|uniref:tetratricopeptide repeat protein 41-like n=1 Tax=Ptychodera flava TaxID=63121 RepID=UPI00396A5173